MFGRITNGAANDLERVTGDRPRDGVRVRHVGRGPVAHDACRQLRALGGDEAAARHRAGAPDRRRLRRGAAAAAQASRRSGSGRRGAARAGDARPRRARRDALRARAGVTLERDRRHRAARSPTRSSSSSAGYDRAGMQARGIHHLGVAVADLDEAVATYERLFGATVENRETFADQGVEAASVLVGGDRVELLAPTGDDTPVGRFLARRGAGDASRRVRGRRRRRCAERARVRRRAS